MALFMFRLQFLKINSGFITGKIFAKSTTLSTLFEFGLIRQNQFIIIGLTIHHTY